MYHPALFLRSGALCLILFLLVAVRSDLHAQVPAPEPTAPKPTAPAEINQAELLKSYLQVREQLHAAELAIANNRLEAEAAARAQATAITEKLDTLRSVLATEREQQQAEALRLAAEQERQRLAAQETNRIVLWVSIAFGCAGLFTMLITTLLQWRGIKRMVEVTAHPQPLPASVHQAWLGSGQPAPGGEAIALSNQRLMSVIDRMERRILELEHTAAQPLPASPVVEQVVEPSTPPWNAETATADQASRIAALLGKGRSLLNANQAEEAVACYDAILALDSNHPEALVKKGSALERLKRDLEAIACYDRAIKADQNMALAYLSKGGVYNRLQRFDEAVECYERALQVEKSGKPITVARVSVSGDWAANGNSVPA